MNIFKKGWLPDLPDFRDLIFEGTTAVAALPRKVDLRAQDAPIYNQGQLGSCTGNAIAALHRFVTKKSVGHDFAPSRLFIYYNERKMLGTITRDSGAYIRDGMKSIYKKGVCEEEMWPYDIAKFKNKPSEAAYAEAKKHQSIEYKRINYTLNYMKQCLADGYPFVFGFTLFNSFETPEVAKTGIMPMPVKTDKALGGHAVMAIGYDDDTNKFIVRNSWGAGWGDKGYFYMPYDFIKDTNFCDDFWTLRKVETHN